MITTVGSLRGRGSIRTAQLELGEVRIDRQTQWGNPIRVAEAAGVGRHAAIIGYAEWLLTECLGETRPLWDSMLDLHGRRLMCWCAPEPCHGHVLALCADWTAQVGKHQALERLELLLEKRKLVVPPGWRQAA